MKRKGKGEERGKREEARAWTDSIFMCICVCIYIHMYIYIYIYIYVEREKEREREREIGEGCGVQGWEGYRRRERGR